MRGSFVVDNVLCVPMDAGYYELWFTERRDWELYQMKTRNAFPLERGSSKNYGLGVEGPVPSANRLKKRLAQKGIA